ncbi:MAG: hypothetical protein LBR74_06785 [Eubacterium sp.]|nr:hypothetical protein [Eubacterium sp.]
MFACFVIDYIKCRHFFKKWKNRYDGRLESLKDRSRCPNNCPKSQYADEIKLVKRIWSKDKNGDRLVMWHNAGKRGYKRCYQTFLRTVRKLSGGVKAKHKTLFEQALADKGIIYHRIRIATPRHNGKVERCHRTDQQRFYRKLWMCDLNDGRKQLAAYQKRSVCYPMMVLNFQSPVNIF